MPTLDETLAAFYPSALTALPAQEQSVFLPSGMPDPVGAAIATLQQVGAAAPMPQAPPMPPPMPVGPAAPEPPPMAIPGQSGPVTDPSQVQGPAPAQPPAPPPAPPNPVMTPLTAPGSVEQGTQQVQAAVMETGQAMGDAAMAQQAAQRATLARQATAVEDAAFLREELVKGTQIERQKNEAAADLETASWIQELQDQAAREPNPNRWWQNQSRLGKALWAIGMFAGAIYKAQTPGAQNVALEMVRQELAQDMEEQRQRMARQLNSLKAKGEVMRDKHARLATDLKDDYAMGLGRIDALERAFMARAVVPGDLDAAAARAQVHLAFQQLKLPYVEGFRKERVEERNAATMRNFQASQAAADRAFRKQQQEDEQAFTLQRDEKQHQYRLAESPVSVSASYTPGGPIPLGKDGRALYSELQGKGLVLKGPDGKPANGNGLIRVHPEDFKEASEVVTKANDRYTQMQELVELLDANGFGTTEFVFGNLDPAIQARINKLGYAIAKEHDPRITNQDFSKGIEQAMGFDPNGNWLSRGKAVVNADAVKKMLRDELNAMPDRVNNTFRAYNRAEVNGQGTSLVWDPDLLGGEKVQEKNAAQIEGRQSPTLTQAPVTGVKDYQAKRKAETDPSRKGLELPPHDSSVVHSIIDTAEGRAPSTVEAKAAEVLKKYQPRVEAINERLRAAGPQSPKAVMNGATPPPVTEGEAERLVREREYLLNTITIAESVAQDAVKRQAAKVKDFERSVEVLQGRAFVNEDWIREQAKRKGLTDAEAEVRRVIEKFKGYKAKNKSTPGIGGF